MGWLEVLHSTGEHNYIYNFYVYYTLSDNAYENYTDVTVSKVRFEQTSTGYIYNRYPSDPRLWGYQYCATLGVGVNGKKLSPQKVTLGNVTGVKDYAVTPVTVRVYHDKDGNGSCDIHGYSQTQCYGYAGTFGWVSKRIYLKKFDRTPANVTISKKNIGENSVIFNVSSSEKIEGLQYKINDGKWISLGALQGSKDYTISSLEKNTTYNIYWKYKKSSNGVISTPGYIKITTDAPAATKVKIVNLQSAKDKISFSIIGDSNVKNPIEYYSSNFGNGWSQWSSSSKLEIKNLKSNTLYSIKGRVKTNNGKITESSTYSIKTKGLFPTIGGIQLIYNKTRELKIKAINYKAQAGIKKFIFTINKDGKILETKESAQNIIVFSNLLPNISYDITITIEDKDGQQAAVSSIFKTKEEVPNNFNLAVSEVSNSSFKVEIPKMDVDFSEINYYLNNDKYLSLDTVKTFTSLDPYKDYTVKVEIVNNEGIKGESTPIIVKTWPVAPDFNIIIEKCYTKKCAFRIELIKEPGVNAQNISYSINNTGSDIQIKGESSIINNLKPNSVYLLKVTVIDKNNQKVQKTISFKTLEDKWVQISINGEPFYKCNLYVISSLGIQKIEKSKRKII